MTATRLTRILLASTPFAVPCAVHAPDGGGGGGARRSISPHFEVLEARLLFDGAGAETFEHAGLPENHAYMDVADNGARDSHVALIDALTALPPATENSLAAPEHEVVFIDGSLPDIASITSAIGPNVTVYILDPAQDGVAQMAATLQGQSGISAIHLISHGDQGELALGTATLTSGSIAGEYQDDLAIISAALSQDADILIYGCDFASGQAGHEAARALAAATGADVAASEDVTGAAALGGDWDLEYTVGEISTAGIEGTQWNGLLTLGNTGSWTVSGLSATNTVQGVTATISFSSISPQSSVVINGNETFATGTFFANGADGDPSLRFVYNWDTTPETAPVNPPPALPTLPPAVGDGGTAVLTITFSQPVTNPIINLDRLGGNMAYDPNNLIVGDELSQSNSALFTLVTPGATLADMTVPTDVGHFQVTATTIQRTPFQNMVFSPGAEAGTSGTNSTAAGSVMVMGTFTTLTFVLSGVGVEGAGGDGIEIGLALDAPPDARNDTFSMNEDATLTGNLFANNGSGADSDPTGDALTVTQINGAPFTVGVPISLATGTLTITDASTGTFTFTPNADYGGPATFAYTIADSNGGTDTATVNITVNPVNDAPAGADNTLTTVEDTPYTFAAADFGFSDPADGPANNLQSVIIDTLPASGTLTLGGVPVIAGQTIPAGSLASLQWTPATDANGTGLASFTFQVVDDGGTANGGQNTDPTPNTITFNVTPVNDPPIIDLDNDNSTNSTGAGTGANYEATYIENAPGIGIADSDFTLTDVDGDIVEMVVTLTDGQIGDAINFPSLMPGGITAAVVPVATLTAPGTMTLTFSGTAGTTTADWQAVLDAITFLPSSNDVHNPNPADRHITVQVSDSNSASSALATATIHVVPQNDPPTLDLDDDNSSGTNAGNVAVTYTENAAPVALNSNIVMTDLDDTNFESATVVHTNPQAGDQLYVNGVLVNPGDSGTVSGISYTVSLNGSGQPTISFSGSAAVATYDSVLQSVSFASSSENPATVTRDITFVVNDGADSSPIRHAFVTVIPVNDAPVAQDDAESTTEDTTVSDSVLPDNGNGPDSDVDSPALTVSQINGAAFTPGAPITLSSGALLSMNSDGSYSYDPNGQFESLGTGDTGTDSFSYQISDGAGGFDTATVTITITGINDAPVAQDDAEATTEDTSFTDSVLPDNGNGADSDAEADPLNVMQVNGAPYTPGGVITLPSGALLTMNSDGSYSYDPNGQFESLGIGNTGTDSFTYQISDGNGGLDTATVTITINGVNDAPVAIDDGPVPVTEDTPVSGDVLLNDSDVDGGPLSVVDFTIPGVGTMAAGTPAVIPGVGTLTINPDGSYTFTPEPDYDGPVPSATYTITDGALTDTAVLSFADITDVNDAPVANDDGPVPVTEDTPASGDVLLNDSDVDGDPLTVVDFTIPGVGTVAAGTPAVIPGVGTLTINPDGSYTFTPEPDYNGPVPSATYTITDGALTDTAVLSFADITDVNDAPVANDDIEATSEDAVLSESVLPDNGSGPDSDVDGDTLSVTQVNGVAITSGVVIALPSGALLTMNSDGTYSYNPNGQFEGLDAGETATDSFTYQISDGAGGFDTATVTISINGLNDPPNVDPGALLPQTSTDGEAVSVDVSAAFTDVDGEDLDFSSIGLPPGLTLDPETGLITGTITADASQGGPYTVTITANDPDGATLSATFNWSVANLPPVANDDTSSGLEDAPQSGNLLNDPLTGDADTAPDTDPLSVTEVNGAPALVGAPIPLTYGSLTVNVSGAWTFTPNGTANALNQGETVTETVTYTISDGNGGTDTATLTITIIGENDAPIVSAVPDQANNDSDTVTPVDVGAAFADPDGDVLNFTAAGLPPGLAIDPVTGVITGTLTPDASQGGPYSVTVTATDPFGNTYPVTFEWAVTNPPPVATSDAATTDEDTAVSIPVLANDNDPDGDPLIVSSTTSPANGTVIVNPDGSITYTPDANFNGTDTFTYTISDGNGGTATATVTVTINPVNDQPQANPLPPQSNNDADPVTLDISSSFSDLDGDDLDFAALGLPPGLTIDPETGVISGTIDPSASQGGPYTVTITANDPSGATISSTFTWAIANPAPDASDNAGTVTEDTALSVDAATGLLSDDADLDGDPLTVVDFTIPGVGTVAAGTPAMIPGVGTLLINPDGSYTFTPEPDYDGAIPPVTYSIADGNGGTDSAALTLTMTPVNDAPVATDDGPVPVTEDTPVSGDVLLNDSDVDGDPLTVVDFTIPGVGTMAAGTPAVIPGVGTLKINPDGSYTFTPEPDYDGPVPSATYTITDGALTDTAVLSFADITDVNDAPVANDDGPVPVTEDTPASGDVLLNDSDVDGDPLTVVDFTIPGVGTVAAGTPAVIPGVGTLTINPDGSYTFTPEPDYNGPVPSATYTITDGALTDTAVLSFADITDVNDPPVGPPGGTLPPASTSDGAAFSIPLPPGSFTDVDVDTLTYSLAPGAPAWLSINPVTGEITGTAPSDASVADPYPLTVIATDPSGASASAIRVLSVANPPPLAANDASSNGEDAVQGGSVLANDADTAPDSDGLLVSAVNGLPGMVGQPIALTYGALTVAANGTWTFTPNATANGLATGEVVTETITYQIADGQGGFDTATLAIEIVGINDAPEEQGPLPDQSNSDGETITPLDVSGAFADPHGDPLTFTATGLPPGLSMDPATGVISGTLAPDASQTGPYLVTISSTDPTGNTASTTFDWAVANPSPEAIDNVAAANEDTPVLISVLANDSDPDGDSLSVVGATDPANGTVTINPDGSITYMPDANFSGTDTFTYTITDGNGGIATASVTVSVGVVNDVPQGTPIAPQTSNDADAPTLDVSANFSDPEGQPLTFTATGLPPGLAIDPATGVISGTIDPDASQGGPYSVVVTATDPDGGTVSVPFQWSVNNPPPLATDNAVGTNPGSPVTFDVLGNDSDPDGDPLAVQSVTQPSNGSVVINPDGTLTYTPNAGFSGTDVFSYTVSDGNGGTDTAMVSVQVPAGPPIPDATPISSQADNDGETVSVDISGNFVDPNGQPLTFTAAGLPPGLTLDPVTGVISGTLTPDASQGGPYPVTVTATDPDGNTVSTAFQWNVANPSPDASDNITSTAEETPVTINLLGNDTDPDGDPLAVTSVTQPLNGTVTLNPDGTVIYTPNAGFNGADVFTYTISDGNGGTDTATVTVNVGPVNDNPINSTIPVQDSSDGDSIVPLDVSGAFSDPDGDPLTFTATGLPPGLSLDPATGFITGTLAADASQGGPYTVIVTARDPDGGEATTTFTWEVDNLPPVAANDSNAASEDGPAVTGNVLTGAGADHDTAPDSDPLILTGAEQDGSPITLGAPFTTSGGGTLILNADGSYSFDPGTAYNGLDAGETVTEVITYAISDGNGGGDSATLTITIIGENDRPVIVDPNDPGPDPANPKPAPDPDNIIPDVITVDGATPAPLDVSPFIVDPDGEPITFTATGLPPGLSIDPTTGVISGTLPPDASQGGPYTAVITATDPDGASVSTTITYTVTNPLPVAADDASSNTEDSVQSGNVLGNDADTPPDSDPLTVTAVTGGIPGQPIALTYGTLVLNADGTWTFTPNAAANALPVGAVVTHTVGYTVSDGNGGTDTATLEIEIIGLNDAPLAVNLPDQSDYEGDDITIDISGAFSDPDGDDLDFTATGLPPGLSINPETGLITGTIAPGASNDGPFTITVTANDGNGGTVSTTFVWEVLSLPAPAPAPDPVPLPIPPLVTAGLPNIDHVILDTVNALGALDGTPVLIDHVITRTVESLGSLNSAVDLDNQSHVISRLNDWLERQGRDSNWLQAVFDDFGNSPYAGDSLDLALTLDTAEMFRLKTVVVDDAMFIGVDLLADGVSVTAITSDDGRGLPQNVATIDSQNLVVNIIGAQAWIDLLIQGRMPDGTAAAWRVSVNSQSGEIIAREAALAPLKIAAE